MRALRYHGQKDIRLEDVDVLKCGKDQVKVTTIYRAGPFVDIDDEIA